MEETRADRRYVFFDIDGTLAVGTSGTQYIPDSAVEAIKGLRKACHFTAIATGRAMAKDYRRRPGFANMVSDGGYGITVDGTLRELRSLPCKPCPEVLRECGERTSPGRCRSMTPARDWHRMTGCMRCPMSVLFTLFMRRMSTRGEVTWISTFSGTMGDRKEDFDGAAESERFLP